MIKYIISDKIAEYYWLLLQYTYGHKPTLTNQKTDENLIEFKALTTDIELNNLLSFLKNNLYIDNREIIKEEFFKFFNTVVLVDNLKYLDEYQFLMSSNTAEETALGIYSTVKKESSYKLLHWLNHKGLDKVNHFRGTIPDEIKKIQIYTLKPAICYYFLGKYFEDFFKSVLDTLGYTYIANYVFFDKKSPYCEIDFFVKTEKKFYYFETKTKLNKSYIDDFLKKSSKIIDKFKPMIDHGMKIDFILLGAYSDDNVKDYQYFINEYSANKEFGYNTKRDKLNCKPYHFSVPIPDKEGKSIICIVEPEYEKLKKLVLQICPK